MRPKPRHHSVGRLSINILNFMFDMQRRIAVQLLPAVSLINIWVALLHAEFLYAVTAFIYSAKIFSANGKIRKLIYLRKCSAQTNLTGKKLHQRENIQHLHKSQRICIKEILYVSVLTEQIQNADQMEICLLHQKFQMLSRIITSILIYLQMENHSFKLFKSFEDIFQRSFAWYCLVL